MSTNRKPSHRTRVNAERTLWQRVISLSLMGTMAIGVLLRWFLAGALELSLSFPHLRHAHSHLGYFGLLFPLAWMGWSAAGVHVFGAKVLWIYLLFVGVACVGFVIGGYGPVAIAGSTVVSGFWLWSAWALRDRMRDLKNLLGAVGPGLVASLACVPPIAIYLRPDPALAQGFVSTFLAGLLFTVVVPSCLAARNVRVGPWPLFLVSSATGALWLGVAPNELTQVGLVLFSALLMRAGLSKNLELHLRVVWTITAAGLVVLAIGIVPNIRSVALGAIHFLVLGPILGTCASLWLPRPLPAWAWWCGHACWSLMAGSLVAQAYVADAWIWSAAAWGGSLTMLWWVVILTWSLMTPQRSISQKARS